MSKINGEPMLMHRMRHYAKYNYNEFYIALGFKGNVIKDYFKNKKLKWKINLIDTGLKTMTGGRLKRLEPFLKNETFMLTYGDGLSNINLNKLYNFHKRNKKMITLTAVRPPARFGALKIKGNYVSYFKEKSKLDEGWINGGFFVIEPSFLKFISNDSTFLEREPLEKATKRKNLLAYKHNGFWQCMDTVRDKNKLEERMKKK